MSNTPFGTDRQNGKPVALYARVASAQLTGDAAWQRRLPLLLIIAFVATPAFRRVRGRWLLLLFPVLFVVNVAVAFGTILVLKAAMSPR